MREPATETEVYRARFRELSLAEMQALIVEMRQKPATFSDAARSGLALAAQDRGVEVQSALREHFQAEKAERLEAHRKLRLKAAEDAFSQWIVVNKFGGLVCIIIGLYLIYLGFGQNELRYLLGGLALGVFGFWGFTQSRPRR